MFASRRFALIGTSVAVLWYICIVGLWAVQPLSDAVPVGVDYTLSTPKAVSISVDCNTLFDDSARDDAPLPTLKAQPEGKPALAFAREPCVLVHDQARIVFFVDSVLFFGVIVVLVWFAARRRRSTSSPPTGERVESLDSVDLTQ